MPDGLAPGKTAALPTAQADQLAMPPDPALESHSQWLLWLFAVRLSALIDGLGKAVVLGDEWMTLPRMLEICEGVVQAELDPAGNQENRTSSARLP
jgi:hypothetical protein